MKQPGFRKAYNTPDWGLEQELSKDRERLNKAMGLSFKDTGTTNRKVVWKVL